MEPPDVLDAAVDIGERLECPETAPCTDEREGRRPRAVVARMRIVSERVSRRAGRSYVGATACSSQGDPELQEREYAVGSLRLDGPPRETNASISASIDVRQRTAAGIPCGPRSDRAPDKGGRVISP